MKYIIAPSYREGDIIHSASGTQRTNHKYIDRVMGKNGKCQYIYTRAAEKVKRGAQATKYAIRNERMAQNNLRNEKRKAAIRNHIADAVGENAYQKAVIKEHNEQNIKAARDRTALGKLKKNAGNVIKKKINKGLDWLEHNKIFSIYDKTSMKNPYTGKETVLSKKKQRFKTVGPNRSGR